jgi:hypothetical protein
MGDVLSVAIDTHLWNDVRHWLGIHLQITERGKTTDGKKETDADFLEK